MEPAALYLRMSTDDQDTSIEQQRTQLLAKFSSQYIILPDEYKDEGKSGSKDVEKRTDFMRLLADSGKGLFKVILCYDLSRFSRLDNIEGAFAKKMLRDNGIRLVTILDGEIDWNTTTGRIIDSVLSEAQHDYSVRLAASSLRGKLLSAQKGKPFGQLTPYGLARRVVDTQGNIRMVPRTERFRKPKEWFQEFVKGDEQEVAVVEWLFGEFRRRDVSFHQLARELNERGIPSPSGRKWVYQTVYEILTNVRYVGDLTCGRDGAGRFYRLDGDQVVKNTEKRMKTRKPNALHIENTHKGIIERDLFQEVQEKVARRWRSGKHACRENGFALGGILYCGCCEKPLYGNDGTKRAKSKNGVKYSCKGIHRRPDARCGQWGIHEDEVLPFLLRTLLEQIDRQILLRADAPFPHKQSKDTRSLEKRLASLKEEYKNGLRRLLKLPDEMKKVAGDLEQELRAWKEEIERLEAELAAPALDEETWQELLRRRKQWWATVKDSLTYVATENCHSNGKVYSTGVHLTPAAIRELFERIECRLTLWWERASDRRYSVVQGRLKAGGKETSFDAAQFDQLRSLMV